MASSTGRPSPDDLLGGLRALRIEDYTSADYHGDNYASIHLHEKFVRDQRTVAVFREAICGNAHLFRDKVGLCEADKWRRSLKSFIRTGRSGRLLRPGPAVAAGGVGRR